eukprot:tig00000498_g1642.t1
MPATKELERLKVESEDAGCQRSFSGGRTANVRRGTELGGDLQLGSETIGTYLSRRLEEIGVHHYFAVPGDYNLGLLDQLLMNKNLEMIGCCNELNAGYAADGYARAKGVGAVVFTFTVGGLSLINAVAGAYSEDLPLICISGGPNTNDFSTNRIIHHTTGLPNRNQQYEMFKTVTAEAVVVNSNIDAPRLIDKAIAAALKTKKPVYIEISCNLSGAKCPAPVPMCLDKIPKSNPWSQEQAVMRVAELWSGAVKPVLVAGSRMRGTEARATFLKLAERGASAVAVMPDAKGMFPENHGQFIGTYWGMASAPFTCEVVESCDLYVFVGPIFNDYTTVGYSTLITKEKMVLVSEDRVRLPGGQEFGCVYMAQFLAALAASVAFQPKDASLVAYRRLHVPPGDITPANAEGALETKVLYKHIQNLLKPSHSLLVETGDSWFWGQKLKLPDGATYEFQMQYGSIGWSVGAVLGYAMATRAEGRRAIGLIGDGSFQMTCQELSTMIRNELNPIIFLLNNRGYTIEVEIHDGPYNRIQNWDYKGLVDVFLGPKEEGAGARRGKAWSARVSSEQELVEALKRAEGEPEALAFIEVSLHPDDCSKELLEWGSRVAAANGRPDRVFENY